MYSLSDCTVKQDGLICVQVVVARFCRSYSTVGSIYIDIYREPGLIILLYHSYLFSIEVILVNTNRGIREKGTYVRFNVLEIMLKGFHM